LSTSDSAAIERALARAGLVDAAAGGPWNVLGDVAALAVAIEALSESKPDTT